MEPTYDTSITPREYSCRDMPTFHCMKRGVWKSSPVAIRLRTPVVVGVMPAAGLDSCVFWKARVLANGGLVKAFCSKMPTSTWS